MTNALFSIGSGPAQRPLIEAAKCLGFEVVGLDQNPKPACADLLSEQVVCSTFDADAALSKLTALKTRFSFVGVLSRTSGPALQSAAKIAKALEVRGAVTGLADAAVNKSQLREDAERAGVPVAPGVRLLQKQDPEIPLPWVVKPDAPLVGKQNVRWVDELSRYTDAFQQAKTESLNNHVLVEQAVPGIDVGYMALRQNGQTVLELLYDEYVRFDADTRQAIGLGVGAPALISQLPIGTKVRENARAMLDYWGHDDGFAFCSFRVTKQGEVFLYEANPGLCGDDIADHLLPAVWPERSCFTLEVQAVAGQPLDVTAREPKCAQVVGGRVHLPESEAEVLAQLGGDAERYRDVLKGLQA